MWLDVAFCGKPLVNLVPQKLQSVRILAGVVASVFHISQQVQGARERLFFGSQSGLLKVSSTQASWSRHCEVCEREREREVKIARESEREH